MSDQYFREGAGSDLYSGQLAQATQLQDEYVYYICRQAGNPNVETSAGPSCVVTDWTAFTLAGMNDIEQRCDAYLNWLDAQRRDRTPVLTQIAAMGAATGGIMGVSGAGTQALAIVATAFGLASTTYANLNSRLLLDVDHSTVQTVVYTRQQQYRKANAGLIVPDRPAAIYLLRGYLRICMPITIETDINTSVTLVRSGAPLSVLQAPLVRAALPGGGQLRPPIKAAEPLRPTHVQLVGLPGWKTDEEKTISAPLLTRLQTNVLCVPGTAQFDDSTRDGIKIFQQSFGSPSTGEVSSATELEKMAKRDRGAACPAGAKNWFEFKSFFPTGAEDAERVKQLQHFLNVVLGADDKTESGALDEDTRAKIEKVRANMSGLNDITDAARQVTPAFFSQLRKEAMLKENNAQ